jgi:hypothetical protein
MKSFEYITKIELIEDELEDILKNEFELVKDILNNKKAPNAIRAIFSFNQKLAYIKNGIFQESQDDNLYVVKILYRSFLEHFIKGYYIILKLIKEQSDLIGSDYYKYSEIIEIYKYGKSIESINKLLKNEESNKNVWDILIENEPSYNNYSLNDLITKSSQFKYNRMIKYIVELSNNDSNEDIDLLNRIILNTLPSYSELSSFVHGGPKAEKTMYELLGDANIKDTFYVGASRGVMNLYWIYKSFSLLIFSNYNKDFLTIHNKVRTTFYKLIKE